MKKLSVCGLTAAMVLIMGAAVCAPAWSMPLEILFHDNEDVSEIGDIKQDIIILNLLNVLYLTPQQINQLLEIHQRRQVLMNEVQEQVMHKAGETKSALTALRHALMAGRDPEERVARLAQKSNHEIQNVGAGAIAEYRALAREAEAVLNESQKVIVQHYVSCIIPPKNEINPLRVGQSGGENGRRMLEMLRSIPEHKYQERKDKLVERAYERIEKLTKGRPNVSLDGLRELIVEHFDRVRSMSDTEFKLYDENPIRDYVDSTVKMKQLPDASTIQPKIMKFILYPRAEVLLKNLHRN